VSYTAAVAGLLARLRSVDGLAAVVHGEPTAVHEAPMVYVLFAGLGRDQSRGQLVANVYRVDVRLVVAWQDNAAAEDELASFVNAIPAAFDAAGIDGAGHRYATLGGAVNVARVAGARSGEASGFHVIAGTTYRTATFEIEIVDKGAGGSGI